MSRPSYETQARRRKAVTLVEWCRREGLSAEAVTAMNDATRRQACSDAFVNLASPETWAIVIGVLGASGPDLHPAIRAALPEDPFDGLA